eukprot:CAMPEP_0197318140 /NCGR_PEP_ID=MMETSP0891-20130614/49656_1 /TAXON_ID=44058 ORGANISM="Aureoumbra lagunensis, Strain CCMP1510" /NCGR_SAMPLE_ID=MMETSP0891 /ASSEMBLY_ACC=CAM_ASM_000534 /LENGTH=216 /DNA_ID=CAMNT_0042808437 /DNA_START=110 /DNA_END=760 /DNA_ORIENTATION=+
MPSFPFDDKKRYVVRDFSSIRQQTSRGGLRCVARALLRLPATQRCTKFDVGKFNERRIIYTTELFVNGSQSIENFSGVRDIHVGLDLGAPALTRIHAPLDGSIWRFGYNPKDGDYGHVIITAHHFEPENISFWILYGHLDASSVSFKRIGDPVRAGDPIARCGRPHENGGWPSHLHLQLSLIEPQDHDLPGVVNQIDLPRALRDFPDPRLIVGPVY